MFLIARNPRMSLVGLSIAVWRKHELSLENATRLQKIHNKRSNPEAADYPSAIREIQARDQEMAVVPQEDLAVLAEAIISVGKGPKLGRARSERPQPKLSKFSL
jgi:hypothetical protein